MYDPQGDSHEGGQIAAPVVSKILSETLPYLGIPSDEDDYTSDEDNNPILPDVRNKTVTEAVKVLNNLGFKVQVKTDGNQNEILVTDQVPKPGIKLSEDSIICLYADENDVRVSVKVPDLKGKTLTQARKELKSYNLNIISEGYGKIISQDISKGTSVEEGTIIKVTLKPDIGDAH